jgi:hypothetical protein
MIFSLVYLCALTLQGLHFVRLRTPTILYDSLKEVAAALKFPIAAHAVGAELPKKRSESGGPRDILVADVLGARLKGHTQQQQQL